ncbi:hypothetical protein SFR_2131 [Streptomyces sp. FR-008]|nr:hypothetical protein SFR_2131 [Streptomyces sp. FR-008]
MGGLGPGAAYPGLRRVGEGHRGAFLVGVGAADRVVGDDLQVERAEAFDVLVDGEEFQGAGAGGGAEAVAAGGVAEQREARLGEGVRVLGRHDEARTADRLDDRADLGGDGGAAAEHRLDHADREAFDHAGEDDDGAGPVGGGQVGGARLGLAGFLEADGAVLGAEFAGQFAAVGQVGGALGVAGDEPADQAQPCRGLGAADLGEGVQQRDEVLAGLDPPHPDQRAGIARRAFADLREGRRVEPGVDGPQPVPLGPAPLLPAADVGAAGGDQGGLVVDLAGEELVEGGAQGADGGGRASAGGGEVVAAQRDVVLGDEQGDAEEVQGEQAGQGGGAPGGGVAEVDAAESAPSRAPGVRPAGVALGVPVEREGPQGAFDEGGDGEEVGDAGVVGGAQGSGGPAGAFEDADGVLGAQRRDQAAFLAGQVGEAVEPLAETVLLGAERFLVRPGCSGADGGGEVGVVGVEAAAGAAAVGDAVLLGAPEGRGADPVDLRRERHPAGLLLGGGAAEGVEVELVGCEPAHEPVAPQSALAVRVRVATLGQQSDAHLSTSDLPCGEPPLSSRRGHRPRSGMNVCGQEGGTTDGCPSRHQKG